MRSSGRISFLISLGIHALLIGAIFLCIGETNSTPPRIHLVYGEHGSESSPAMISAPGEANPPAIQVQATAASSSLTDALDAELIGGSFDSLANSINQMFDFKHRPDHDGKLFLDPTTGEPTNRW